jgi:hypothetical protein
MERQPLPLMLHLWYLAFYLDARAVIRTSTNGNTLRLSSMPMTTEQTIKNEHQPRTTQDSSRSQANQCQAPRQNCALPRTLKRDCSLHELCALHRRQAQRNDQQRKHLLRVLMDALKSENEGAGTAELAEMPRRRPRLVLLGNQQTLILGVVLSEQGDFSGISRSML